MASKYIQKFPIPGSFPDILHDFVREVLRDQPENIYEYGAAYFTAMDEVSNTLFCLVSTSSLLNLKLSSTATTMNFDCLLSCRVFIL